MSASTHARPVLAPAPWLPSTASPARLESDLRARGWEVRWQRDGSVALISPQGERSEHYALTTAQTVREAYAAARCMAAPAAGGLGLKGWEAVGGLTRQEVVGLLTLAIQRLAHTPDAGARCAGRAARPPGTATRGTAASLPRCPP